MRIGNLRGRLSLLSGDGAVDVERASGGRFAAEPQLVYDRWAEFRSWADGITGVEPAPVDPVRLGPPTPGPRQIFAIGLNYHDHAAESGFEIPQDPVVFTKYATSIAGPRQTVTLPPGSVDWEVELVAVIGAEAWRVPEGRAWEHVAGLMVGQDLSERELQHSGPAPQFGLAKSFRGFSPLGPVLVTPDELDNRDDLALECDIDGEVVQRGRTSQMIFSVPELIARLSAVLPLLPGDLIFTGTPAGVGAGRKPPRFLRAGERLRSRIEGIGEIEQEFVATDTEERK